MDKPIITPTATSNAEKKQYLNANGWSERLVANNWVNDTDAEKRRVNIEYGGLCLDEAYNLCCWQVFKLDFMRVMKKQALNSISMSPKDGVFSLEWLDGGKTYRVAGYFDGYGFRVNMERKEEVPGVSSCLSKSQYIKAVRFQLLEINTPEQFVELFYNSLKKGMKTPKIQTDKGKQPVTVVPNEHLVEAFLGCCNVSEDEELVRLLCYAEPSNQKAATILRQCLTEGRRLIPVYPGLGDTPPKDANYIGEIFDGGLYLV